METLISPSLLSANFINLKKDIEMINNSEADWLHLDIMDGVFVPNISFGFPVIEAVADDCTSRKLHQAGGCYGRHDDERTLRGLRTSAPHHSGDSRRWHESRCYTQSFYSYLHA